MTSAKIRPLGSSLLLILANVQLERLFLRVLRFTPSSKINISELQYQSRMMNFVVCKVCYIKNILAALKAMDPDLPQAQNMGIRSPMSEGSPNSVL